MGKYILRGHEYVRSANYDAEMRENGYSRLVRQEVVREFHTAMGMLRFCLKNGAFRDSCGSDSMPMERVSLGQEGRASRGFLDTFFRFNVTDEHLTAMRRAHARYVAALHYWREIEPEWRDVGDIHYADNSIEREQVNRRGEKRQVVLMQAHGDIC